jgi:hypothetical protein
MCSNQEKNDDLRNSGYLGLGVGGMERMIVYPILIWMIGFGGGLIALPEKS